MIVLKPAYRLLGAVMHNVALDWQRNANILCLTMAGDSVVSFLAVDQSMDRFSNAGEDAPCAQAAYSCKNQQCTDRTRWRLLSMQTR